MPEVIEIRKYADFLTKKVKGATLTDIIILKGRYDTHGPFENYNLLLENLPLKILDIRTKGKFLYIVLENDYYIFSTLGLSGGWVFSKNGKDRITFTNMLDYANSGAMQQYKKTALNNLNVQFKTTKGSIFYYDALSFGTLKLIKGFDDLRKKLATLGPDIMEDTTTFEVFLNQMEKRSVQDKEIGLVLLNQKIISGIGNYLRADVLWASEVSPFRLVRDLTTNELEKIYNNAKVLIWYDYDYDKGINIGIINEQTKVPSDYDRDFFIYRQDTDPHGNQVLKDELYTGKFKRFIYWVKEVQK